MKKFFTSQKGVITLAITIFLCLGILLILVVAEYKSGVENLATQQQWTKGKESFDKAYEIAASDKLTPDKTLYVPNLTNCIGLNIDQCVSSLGQGAKVTASNQVGSNQDAITETTIMLTNESSDQKSVAPKVVATTNNTGIISKISFTGSTWALGYPRLSFSDIVNNYHLVEKTLNEAGLSLDIPSISVPENKTLYKHYDTDGTTVINESYVFSGKNYVNGRNYIWEANPVYDYSTANQSGNLSDTVRYITITIQ